MAGLNYTNLNSRLDTPILKSTFYIAKYFTFTLDALTPFMGPNIAFLIVNCKLFPALSEGLAHSTVHHPLRQLSV